MITIILLSRSVLLYWKDCTAVSETDLFLALIFRAFRSMRGIVAQDVIKSCRKSLLRSVKKNFRNGGHNTLIAVIN